jgi:hypothetical protein
LDLWTFSGTANDDMLFTLVETSGDLANTSAVPQFALYSPSGSIVGAANYNANGERRFTLPETGTYVVRVRASNLITTGGYNLGLRRINPNPTTVGTISNPGTYYDGTIVSSGETDLITFSGSLDDVVLVALIETSGDLTTTSAHPQMTVYAPSGATVGGSLINANSQTRLVLPETGTYVVRVLVSNLVTTGGYRFGFERLVPLAAVDGSIISGQVLSDSIDGIADTDLISYTGTTGDQIQITLTETGGDFTAGSIAPQATLIAPSGTVVGTAFNGTSQRSYTLTESGTYVIRVTANNLVSTGTYDIGLDLLP